MGMTANTTMTNIPHLIFVTGTDTHTHTHTHTNTNSSHTKP